VNVRTYKGADGSLSMRVVLLEEGRYVTRSGAVAGPGADRELRDVRQVVRCRLMI
jgi:hypothetical protein